MPRRETELPIIVGLTAGGALGAAVGGPVGAIAGMFSGGLVGMSLGRRGAALPDWKYH